MTKGGATAVDSTPVLILVNPQMGENIGAVARAMMNFGLRELRIVNPRDGWPNAAAVAMAAHGAEIIENATVFATTREAVADLHYLYASTARDRRLNKPQFSPRDGLQDAATRLQAGERVGILFGPERSGLHNEDVAYAQAIVTVPADPDHASLNIAQCAVVLSYEWFQCVLAQHREQQAAGKSQLCRQDKQSEPSTQDDINQFFDHLEQELDKTYFFKLDEKKPRMWRNLRATFQRAELSRQEVHSLRGVVTALVKGEKRPVEK